MFCLSWIGLYYGCGLELRVYKKFPSKVILFNIIEPIIVFAVITLVGTIYLYVKYSNWEFTYIAVTTAIFCSFTIFRRHGILIREGDTSHHPALDNLLPVGNIFAVIALCIFSGFLSETNKVNILGLTFSGVFSVVILCILLGITGGILLNMLITGVKSSNSISTILIGGTALFSGMSYVFTFSPLFIGAISGLFLINSTLKRLQTLKVLNETNEIIERIFMFVLGTMLSSLIHLFKNELFFIFLYALGIFVFRSSLKYIISIFWTSKIQDETDGSSLIWIGLTGQGILASGATFECSLYAYLLPSFFIIFVTLLVLNQLTLGFYVWYKGKVNKPE